MENSTLKTIISIISPLLLTCGLCYLVFLGIEHILLKHESQNYYLETSEVIITVENKDTSSHFVGVAGKGGHMVTEYFIYWDDKKVKVSSVFYNQTEIGDSIIIQKISKYRKKDNVCVSERYNVIN